jgi:hypothetical protein
VWIGGATAGGAFSGVLTGGNGRAPGEGQVLYYEFSVRNHVNNITADVSLTNDFNDHVGSYLVSPDGDTLGYGQKNLNGNQTGSLTAYAANPMPGTWTLVVDFAGPIVGGALIAHLDGTTWSITTPRGPPSSIISTKLSPAGGSPQTQAFRPAQTVETGREDGP